MAHKLVNYMYILLVHTVHVHTCRYVYAVVDVHLKGIITICHYDRAESVFSPGFCEGLSTGHSRVASSACVRVLCTCMYVCMYVHVRMCVRNCQVP